MERFSVGDVVRVVNANGSPYLTHGATKIVTKVDAKSGFVLVTGCDEWLWAGRFERFKPKRTSKDIDGSEIAAGNVVEFVDDREMAQGFLTIGARYRVAGVSSLDPPSVIVTDDNGMATAWLSRRFRKLAPTPLERREDA